MKLTKELKVTASVSGSDEYLSVIGTFEIIENAITELMGELKIDGITAKNKYNAFWVFVKNKVKFFKKVKWNEKINVTCFISLKSLAKLNFDIIATNLNNQTIFYARVEGCALDISTQKIRKISSVGVDESIVAYEPVMDVEFAKFDNINLPIIEQVKIRSTNIDMSHHTNNLEYLRLILNTYSVKMLEKINFKEIEVNYVSQTFENDTLNVLKLNLSDKDIIILQKEDRPVVKCEILF